MSLPITIGKDEEEKLMQHINMAESKLTNDINAAIRGCVSKDASDKIIKVYRKGVPKRITQAVKIDELDCALDIVRCRHDADITVKYEKEDDDKIICVYC